MDPVLLLHGALGSQSQLSPLKASLESSGRSVYSLNFSGHSGEAFRETFGIETFADDTHRFLQKNQILKADIFGYSMGGYVALWLAKTHPHLVGKIITLGTKFDWNPESAAREVKKMNPDKIQEKIPAFARILEARHSPNSWKELLNKTALMMTELGSQPLLTTGILSTINHPVSILLGDQDDMADHSFSEEVATILPQGRFQLLKSTPHPIEKADLTILCKLIGE
jgi:pimeloyl-ACP methyl ester carboxylesterase